MIKPSHLKKGDTIGIISPAGAIKELSQRENVLSFFGRMGYKVKFSSSYGAKKSYLAGEDCLRLKDLHDFFVDDEVKAIVCSRGGYGTVRLLEDIDFNLIKAHPKIFVGYSDITALLLNFVDKSELITFHGPLAMSDFGAGSVDEYTANNFFDVLEGRFDGIYSNIRSHVCIKQGSAAGQLVCGNLAVLAGLVGTPYFPELDKKILLLEDIGEPLYKLDRMLQQMKLSGAFNKVRAVLFGDFTACADGNIPELIALVREVFAGIDCPIGFGFQAGHSKEKATLPMGANCFYSSEPFSLKVLEDFLV